MKRRFLLVTAALGATTAAATALAGCPRVYANPKGAHYDAGTGSGSGSGSATPDAKPAGTDATADADTTIYANPKGSFYDRGLK